MRKLLRFGSKHILLSLCLLFTAGNALGQRTLPPVPEKLVSRGRGLVTLTFSLNQRHAENENLLVQQVVDQNLVNFKITALGGYAVRDNLTLGMGLTYGRDRQDRVYLEDGLEVTARSVSNSYTFGPHMRNYVPLGNGTLQIVIQTDLQFIIEESLQRVFRPSDIDKIEGDTYGISLGLKPGAVLLFDRHWALEVSVGLAGLSSTVRTETRNDDTENQTRIVRSTIDLQVNLLALNLGIAYYF